MLEVNEFKNINLFLFSLTLILGHLSYKYIEKSFINNKQYSLLFFSFIFLSFFMILKPFSALDYKGSDVHTNLSDETVFSDYDCWVKYSLYDDNFQEIENCFINNNSNKNLIILGDSSSASISKNIIQKDLFMNYNLFFVSISNENFFEDFNNYINCNSCFLTWIQYNPSTIVVSIELHRFIESDGIYYTNEHSNKNVEIFKKNINYLNKYSEKLLLLESFPTIPSQATNPIDLLKNDKFGVIKEIYIPYSSWVNNTQSTSKTYYTLKNKFDINTVRVNDLFCNERTDKCTIYNHDLFYLDKAHLSLSGGHLITMKLSSILGN